MRKHTLTTSMNPIILLLFAGVAFFSLSACSAGTGQVDPSSQKEAIEETVSVVYETNIDPEQFWVTLIAGQNTALVNGGEITLSAAPLVQDNSFYIPLQDLTKLLGGSYSYEGNTATVQIFGRTCVFRIECPEIEIDGTLYKLKDQPEWVEAFVPGTTHARMEVANDYGPILLEKQVFLPNGMMTYLVGALSYMREYYESGTLIFGNAKDDERGIGPIKLFAAYESLPDTVTAQYEYTGIIRVDDSYSILEYKNDTAAIYVIAVEEGMENIDNMNGKVCAIHIYGSNVPTVRGLQVADSAYKAWLLYGYDGLTNSFTYRVEAGVVVDYMFYSRYCSPYTLYRLRSATPPKVRQP